VNNSRRHARRRVKQSSPRLCRGNGVGHDYAAAEAAATKLVATASAAASHPALANPGQSPGLNCSTRLRASAVALLVTFMFGCASSRIAPPPRAPQWSVMPAAILDSFCSSLRDEGISNATTINVVKTAQSSLITPMSMQSLSDSFFYHGVLDSVRAAADATATASEIPIAIPTTCAWRGIAPNTATRYTDTMTLEISPPIVNPFSRNAAGLFARIALAGEAPTWYWLPLVPRGETWTAGRLTLLPYRQ
jgi:hypothetical protein